MAWTWAITRRMVESDGTTVLDIDYLDNGVTAARKQLAFASSTSRDDAIAQIVAVGRRFAGTGIAINVGDTGQVR